MAYTQAQIDALKDAVARGAVRVRMNGEEVQYSSLAEMRRQIQVMEAELSDSDTGSMAVSYPKTTRGL